MKRPSFLSTVNLFYAFAFLRSFSMFGAVLIPFFTVWGKISLFQIQVLQSWFMFWIFILEIPTGVAADRFGRKFSLGLGGIVTALAVVLYGSLARFEVFLLGEFLFAMGVAFISGADDALLYDALKESGQEQESKKVFGSARSFELSAMFLSALLGGFVASKFGLNAPMYLSFIPFFLATITAFLIKEPRRSENVSESRRYLDIVRKGISFLKSHYQLKLLAIDAVLVSGAVYFVVWFYQVVLEQLKIPVIYFGYFNAFLVLSEIIVARNFVRFEKLFGSGRNFLKFSALAAGLAFLVVAFLSNVFTVIIFLVFAGGFGLTRLDLMSVYMNRFIPSEQRATVLSSISMLRRFLLVVLNPLMGFVADKSLVLALCLAGVLCLGVFLFSPLKREILDGTA